GLCKVWLKLFCSCQPWRNRRRSPNGNRPPLSSRQPIKARAFACRHQKWHWAVRAENSRRHLGGNVPKRIVSIVNQRVFYGDQPVKQRQFLSQISPQNLQQQITAAA